MIEKVYSWISNRIGNSQSYSGLVYSCLRNNIETRKEKENCGLFFWIYEKKITRMTKKTKTKRFINIRAGWITRSYFYRTLRHAFRFIKAFRFIRRTRVSCARHISFQWKNHLIFINFPYKYVIRRNRGVKSDSYCTHLYICIYNFYTHVRIAIAERTRWNLRAGAYIKFHYIWPSFRSERAKNFQWKTTNEVREFSKNTSSLKKLIYCISSNLIM